MALKKDAGSFFTPCGKHKRSNFLTTKQSCCHTKDREREGERRERSWVLLLKCTAKDPYDPYMIDNLLKRIANNSLQ